jgi:hypothetical protein
VLNRLTDLHFDMKSASKIDKTDVDPVLRPQLLKVELWRTGCSLGKLGSVSGVPDRLTDGQGLVMRLWPWRSAPLVVPKVI